MEIITRKIPLKPYSITELAGIYGVCSRTLKKWMRPFEAEVGPRFGRYYTIPQVKIIFIRLDLPSDIVILP